MLELQLGDVHGVPIKFAWSVDVASACVDIRQSPTTDVLVRNMLVLTFSPCCWGPLAVGGTVATPLCILTVQLLIGVRWVVSACRRINRVYCSAAPISLAATRSAVSFLPTTPSGTLKREI